LEPEVREFLREIKKKGGRRWWQREGGVAMEGF